MIYVCSDLHGNYEKYIKIFETIDFTDNDTLFVLGDVIDRGPNGIRILMDMMYRFNVIPILGNHEFMAISILKKLSQEIDEKSLEGFDDDFIFSMMTWFENGGAVTLEEFKKLSKDDREAIIEYLEEFSPYDEITVSGVDYVLVHAGFDNFDENKSLSEYEICELLWTRTDYNKQYFKNKVLITGHTPVKAIKENQETIYQNKNNIAIDCGCGHNGKLGILCLDTMDEFYV